MVAQVSTSVIVGSFRDDRVDRILASLSVVVVTHHRVRQRGTQRDSLQPGQLGMGSQKTEFGQLQALCKWFAVRVSFAWA